MFPKYAMHLLGCLYISLMGIFRIIKNSQIVIYAICSNMSLPFLCGFMPRNSFKPSFVSNWSNKVFHVLGACSFSKVINSIVISNPVNVINFKFWPFVMNHGPYYSMNSIISVIKPNQNVSLVIAASDNFARKTFTPLNFPRKFSRFRVIVKELVQCGWIWGAHCGNIVMLPRFVNRGNLWQA